MQSGPMQSGPMQSGPMHTGPMHTGPMQSAPISDRIQCPCHNITSVSASMALIPQTLLLTQLTPIQLPFAIGGGEG